jgi:hypothetical protein
MEIDLLFIFHRHCNGTGCRQPDLVAFDTGNKTAINVVVMTLVAAFAAILFRQLDSVALDLVHVPTCTPSAPITSICSLISIIIDLRI